MKYLHEKVREALQGRSACHDYQHALHVKQLSLKIAGFYDDNNKKEVIATALLHDVWDHKFVADPVEIMDVFRDHLRHEGFSEDAIGRIYSNIEMLSWSKGQIPRTSEGRIVQDADRITALGATGVMRATTYSAQTGQPFVVTIQHLLHKCLLLKDSMNYEYSKELAKEGHNFLVDFIKRYQKETAFDTGFTNETPGMEIEQRDRSLSLSPRIVKEEVSKFYQESEQDGVKFVKTLKAKGYDIARDNDRIFIIIDTFGGTHILAKLIGVTISELYQFLRGCNYEKTLSVEEIQHRNRLKAKERYQISQRVKELKQETPELGRGRGLGR